MKSLPPRLPALLALLLLLAAACSQRSPGRTPSPGPTETPAAGLPPSPISTLPGAGGRQTPSPAAEIPATSTPAATPSAGASPGAGASPCLPAATGAALQAEAFEGYPGAILRFLNGGGTPEALDAALYQAGIANQPVAVRAADLTGDGLEDVVVSIFDPNSPSIPPGGRLLIYVCQGGEFDLLHEQESQENWGAPGIRYVQDLDSDGAAEVVAGSPVCGAHTCFEELQVLAWEGDAFTNKLQGTSKDLPYPDIQISDPDGDGVFDVLVKGSGFGSVGAGPQRNVSRRWSLEARSGQWVVAEDVLEPSNFRIHALHDAEAAALAGDFEQALLLYGRVIQDESLEDPNAAMERGVLASYALFKSAVVYLLRDEQAFAETTFERQRAEYPVGAVGYAYVGLSEAFLQAYRQGGSVAAGCEAARLYAEERPGELLEPLGSATYGYANPDYSVEDICPW